MPIPTLKMKAPRRIAEEIESPVQRSTMLPRATTTRVHTGVGVYATPHVISPSQGHRERKPTRQGVTTPKIGTRMSGNPTGPPPPPRTSSNVRGTYGNKSNTFDKNYVSSSMKSHPKTACKNIAMAGRTSYSSLQQQTQQANVCYSSNRSSVISNCSSNPPPSTSSSNRNSSSSIGSSFSVGSWNGTSEVNERQDFEGQVTSGTFPRVKQTGRTSNMSDNIPRATVDRSKLRIPNSAKKSFNPEGTTRVVGKPLSTSESSIIGRPKAVIYKPNFSDSNIAVSNSLKRSNFRIKNQTDKLSCVVPNPRIESESSDSEDSKNRVSNKHGKIQRDVKFRKDNIAMVNPFKQVAQNGPAADTETESRLKVPDQVDKVSPEDDDGYSSVAITDQIEEDERCRNKAANFNDSIMPVSIEPMPPLKLMNSYSYFKCIGNGSLKATSSRKEMSTSANVSSNQDVSVHSKEIPTTCTDQMSTTDESNKKSLRHYEQNFPSGKETFNSATFPKNKFSTKMESYPIDQTASKIDDDIFAFSYGKLVNSKTELLMKKANPGSRNIRKFGTTIISPKKNIENSKQLAHPRYTLQNSSMTKIAQNIGSSGYSARPNILPMETEVAINTEASKQLFNRTKSLRFPMRRDVKRELFSEIKSDEAIALSSNNNFKNASFPRGANKYSTVIPRTPPGQKTRQIKQLNTFALHNEDDAEPVVEQQHRNETSQMIEADRANEIVHLKAEQKISKEQVNTLVEQLNSKSKLLSAYEHSLTNMTHRLQHLSSLVEQKDIQIVELKKMVEKACLDGVCISSNFNANKGLLSINRGTSIESLTSIASHVSYFSTASSLFSMDGENKEKKKKNWIRSSISKAFKRKYKKKDSGYDSSSDVESYISHPHSFCRSVSEPFKAFSSLPASPVPQRNNPPAQEEGLSVTKMQQSCNVYDEVKILRQSLQEKESALTESRLEVLSSAHQIEGLKESLQNLSVELSAIKSSKLSNSNKGQRTDVIKSSPPLKHKEVVSKKVNVLIPRTFNNDDGIELKSDKVRSVGQIVVTNTTTWKELFNFVQKSFIDHLSIIDSEKYLGFDINSIESYRIGDLVSTSSNETHELLPYGYFVGEVDCVQLNLLNQSENCTDELSYETLIPKQNLYKYVNLLQENRRIILGGVDGTGKRYLAGKLAEVVIKRLGIQPSSINVAKFQCHQHTSQELSSYLCHINDMCEARRSDLPLVIILEALSSAEGCLDLLSNNLKIPNDQCPYIICTVRISASENYHLLSSLSNFRWISLTSSQKCSDMLLQRICRRASLSSHLVNQDSRMITILEWIPRCFKAINSNLFNCSLQLIEPGAFLPLPKSLGAAQTWFSKIWKATVLPKILEAAEESSSENLQTWQELYSCLTENLPWIVFPTDCTAHFPVTIQIT